jgi:hypothetical protein
VWRWRRNCARIWRGRTTRDKADDYQRYLLENGIAPLEAKGAVGVQMLREDRETETESRRSPIARASKP